MFDYVTSFPQIGYVLDKLNVYVNGTLANLTSTLPNIASEMLGLKGILFDRKLFSDSLFLAAAIFIVFAFSALVSSSDIMFLFANLAFMGTGITCFPSVVRPLLDLNSLLRFDATTIQWGAALLGIHIMVEAYLMERDVREGRKNILFHAATILVDLFTAYTWRLLPPKYWASRKLNIPTAEGAQIPAE
jgi:hypothetical protein